MMACENLGTASLISPNPIWIRRRRFSKLHRTLLAANGELFKGNHASITQSCLSLLSKKSILSIKTLHTTSPLHRCRHSSALGIQMGFDFKRREFKFFPVNFTRFAQLYDWAILIWKMFHVDEMSFERMRTAVTRGRYTYTYIVLIGNYIVHYTQRRKMNTIRQRVSRVFSVARMIYSRLTHPSAWDRRNLAVSSYPPPRVLNICAPPGKIMQHYGFYSRDRFREGIRVVLTHVDAKSRANFSDRGRNTCTPISRYLILYETREFFFLFFFFLTHQSRRVIRTTAAEEENDSEEEKRDRSLRGDVAISLMYCNAHRKGRGVTELGKPTVVLCLCRASLSVPASLYRFSASPPPLVQPSFPTLTQSPCSLSLSLLFQRDPLSLLYSFSHRPSLSSPCPSAISFALFARLARSRDATRRLLPFRDAATSEFRSFLSLFFPLPFLFPFFL